MTETQDKQITADDLTGFKKLRRVRELLAHLHSVGCDRDKAGNRELDIQRGLDSIKHYNTTFADVATFPGRPRGRIVDSRLNGPTTSPVHSSSP